MLSTKGLDYILHFIGFIHLLLMRGIVPLVYFPLKFIIGRPFTSIGIPTLFTEGVIGITTITTSVVLVTTIYVNLTSLLGQLMRFAHKDRVQETATDLQYHQVAGENKSEFRIRLYYLAIFREPNMLHLIYLMYMACSMFPYVVIYGYTKYFFISDILAVLAFFWMKHKVEKCHSEHRASLYAQR